MEFMQLSSMIKVSPRKKFLEAKANRKNKPWSSLPSPLLYGLSNQIKYSAIQEHDYSKTIDAFNIGDRTIT